LPMGNTVRMFSGSTKVGEDHLSCYPCKGHRIKDSIGSILHVERFLS
jgi:hypothetical protein